MLEKGFITLLHVGGTSFSGLWLLLKGHKIRILFTFHNGFTYKRFDVHVALRTILVFIME